MTELISAAGLAVVIEIYTSACAREHRCSDDMGNSCGSLFVVLLCRGRLRISLLLSGHGVLILNRKNLLIPFEAVVHCSSHKHRQFTVPMCKPTTQPTSTA